MLPENYHPIPAPGGCGVWRGGQVEGWGAESVMQMPGGASKPGLCRDFSAIKFLFEMKFYAVGEAFLCQTLNPGDIK